MSKGPRSSAGDHDVDLNWINELRKLPSQAPKIIPRFRFDGLTQKDFEALLSETALSTEYEPLATLLVEKCKKYGFDGVVLETELPQFAS